jgi:hypothetical protein
MSIAEAIHYPTCWDTTAYPTLESALSEVYTAFKCSQCMQAVKPLAGGNQTLIDLLRETRAWFDTSGALAARIDAAIESLTAERAAPNLAALELAALRADELRAELKRRDEHAMGIVWFWQGDGTDHPESLTCQVVIKPDDLRALLAARSGDALKPGQVHGPYGGQPYTPTPRPPRRPPKSGVDDAALAAITKAKEQSLEVFRDSCNETINAIEYMASVLISGIEQAAARTGEKTA